MRHIVFGAAFIGTVAGCGDDDCCTMKRDAAVSDTVDAVLIDAPPNPGFLVPTAPVTAHTETSPGTFTPTTLDLSCRGVARADMATTTSVTLTLTVLDFQSGNTVPSPTVEGFEGAYAATFASTTTNVLTIPTGTGRHGFSVTASNTRRTFTVDLLANASQASQARTVYSLSNATVGTLPALVGQTLTAARSIYIGQLLDCAGHTMRNFIATLSSTAGTVTTVSGVDTYYFDAAVGLPVRHTQQGSADEDGRFMVLQVPPTGAPHYVQMWGFASASDMASGSVSLLAELPIEVIADTVIMATHDPRATH